MFASSTIQARKVPPNHEEWMPHGYQDRAVDFLLESCRAALFLDPGLGKTSIVLEAFRILLGEGIAKKMLIIAPLRVCQLVWRQEGRKWTQFRDLKFRLLHGPKKLEALGADADVYLINPEGISWLMNQIFGKPLPFDTVGIDELTKFKNATAVRHKALCPKLGRVARVWGMTGTPIPNGYLDLFGQMKILDGGLCLGQFYTHYRSKYFEADYSGFGWALRRGATKAIENLIAPYVIRMGADDYLDLPPLVDDPIIVKMSKKARALYDEMKKEALVELGDECLEAGNAAAVYSKLKQMANGAVYVGDGILEPKRVVHIHDAKLDALEDLVEEMNGKPLLVAYEFNHDLKRIQKRLGGKVPFLGSGISGARAENIAKMWNAGKISVLLVHPASAGHGLNFQEGNACHICWYSVTWDYELYDQLIRRILRQGNRAPRIFNHMLIMEDSIDNKTLEVIESKGLTQRVFFDALNAEICHGGKAVPSPYEDKKETEMVKKLSRRSRRKSEEEIEDDEEEEVRPSPRGRRSSRRREPEPEEGEDDDVEDDEEEAPRKSSRRGSKRKLRGGRDAPSDDDDRDDDDDDDDDGEDLKTRARKRFKKVVKGKLDDDDDDVDDPEADLEEPEAEDAPEEAPKRKRSRKSASKKKASVKEDVKTPSYAGELDIGGLVDETGQVIAQALGNEPSAGDILSLTHAIATLANIKRQDWLALKSDRPA